MNRIIEKELNGFCNMVEGIEEYAMMLISADGIIETWNKGANRLTGYTENEIIGTPLNCLYPSEVYGAIHPQNLIAKAEATGKVIYEGPVAKKSGGHFWAHVLITAIRNNMGSIVCYTLVMHETDLYKNAENASDMDEKNRQLQQFVYISSHELQEPVRRILLYSDLINNNIRNKDMVQRNAHKINQSAKQMLSIIEEVLSFSKFSDLSAGFTKVSLNDVVHKVMDDLDALLEERNASVIVNGRLPIVMGMPIQLQQLFTNLITNAVKYNHRAPKITISSTNVITQSNNDVMFLKYGKYYQIDVADNGIGFSPEQSQGLFTMFKRIHDTDKYAGTGVGLALCKKIVENHGGAIKAASVPNQGSVFTIYLPAL